jgi:sporulation protein YlmC with PRC-barrel domain
MTGAGGSIPKEYAVLPIPVGELTTATSNEFLRRPVNDQKGTKIGTLESFIMDTHSGKIEYAIVALKEGANLQPVPWSAIQIKRDGRGTLVPTIDTSKYQLTPSLTKKDTTDLSPSIKELVAQMEVLREQEPRKSTMREPVMKEPAVGGPFGEDQTGSGGLSGARALPPESAPGFEREKDKPY